MWCIVISLPSSCEYQYRAKKIKKNLKKSRIGWGSILNLSPLNPVPLSKHTGSRVALISLRFDTDSQFCHEAL